MNLNTAQETAIKKILDRISEVEGKEMIHTVDNYLYSDRLLLRVKIDDEFKYQYSINIDGTYNKL